VENKEEKPDEDEVIISYILFEMHLEIAVSVLNCVKDGTLGRVNCY